MTINLYYVDGISSIDTPYFTGASSQALLAAQKEYFDNHIVTSLSLGFYPPHYNNVIKFDTNDLDFNDNVNYLSLEYKGKTYYYFIDSVTYLSENIIEVSVTMDVIQTYMFDIRIASGIIERKFIDRWESHLHTWYINREYIRENYGSDLFQLDYKKLYSNCTDYYSYTQEGGNDNRTRFLVVFESTADLSTPVQPTIDFVPSVFSYGDNTSNELYVCDTKYYYCLPISRASLNTNSATVQQGSTHESCDFVETFYRFAKLADTTNIYVLPCNPLHHRLRFINDTTIDVNNNIDSLRVWKSYFGAGTVGMPATFIDLRRVGITNDSMLKDKYTFSFTRNTNLATPFSSSYVPALLDENYYRLSFGDKNANTTYPLYMGKTPIYWLKYIGEISSGNRIYIISCSSDETPAGSYSGFADKYSTAVISSSPSILSLIKDSWQQWYAYNKATTTMALGNYIARIFTAGSSTKSAKIGSDMSSAKAYNYEQVRNKKGQFTSKFRKKSITETKQLRDVWDEVPSNREANADPSSLVSVATSELNAFFAPSTIANYGTLLQDVCSTALQQFLEVYKVNNIDQCANYYHRNGYLVNEYVNSISNIFEYVKNRYYFNVLKMSIPEVHLSNIIEDEDTVDEIKQRLITGIRLWNVDSDISIGNFYYDNVELSYL